MEFNLKEIQVRIGCGEEKALADIYVHFHKRLCDFAKALLRSNEVAEEVVEDIFVKLWSRREKINEIENLTIYLYVAVKNKALNALSQMAKELANKPFDYLDIPVKDTSCNPHDLLITSEMMLRMQHAIEALPPRCKMIFKLVREDGLKYKEISQILNISVNTIDAQMAIAVKRICTALNVEKNKNSFNRLSEKNNA